MNPKFSSLFAVSSENAFTQNDKVSLPSFTRIQVFVSKVTKMINVNGLQEVFFLKKKKPSKQYARSIKKSEKCTDQNSIQF